MVYIQKECRHAVVKTTFIYFFLNDNTGSQGTYLRDGKISYLKRGKGEANVNIQLLRSARLSQGGGQTKSMFAVFFVWHILKICDAFNKSLMAGLRNRICGSFMRIYPDTSGFFFSPDLTLKMCKGLAIKSGKRYILISFLALFFYINPAPLPPS